MTTPRDATTLALRWLCHDLATPISTLVTAAELLGDTADPEINQLISDATRRLAARLRLVRLALGAGDTTMAPAALGRLLRDGLPDTPLTLALEAAPPASIIAGAALILADLHRPSPLYIGPASVHWTNDHPLAANATAALQGRPTDDPRSAVIGHIARLAAAQGWSLRPLPSGIALDPA